MEQCPRCENYSFERFQSSCICYQCNYSPDTDVTLLPIEDEPIIPILDKDEEENSETLPKGA